jgi:(+)-trans-carveol dehydrogenase
LSALLPICSESPAAEEIVVGLFEGKTVLITGAARGQGRSHAVRFAQEGADVIATDVCTDIAATGYPGATPQDLAETARLVQAEGRACFTSVVDVRDHAGMTQAVAEGSAALGVIDVVIANAGISGDDMGILATRYDVWKEVVDINLSGAFVTLQTGCAGMVARGGPGAVILVSSIMGLRTHGGVPAYTSSKHGLVGLMKSAAHELSRLSIRVNSVHPGNVLTPMIENDALFGLFRPDLEHPTAADVAPLMRGMNLLPQPWAMPSDITEAVIWLASDQARYVTGVALPIDLGALLK